MRIWTDNNEQRPESRLRSWVQIPPGPLFTVVQLRHCFEFNFGKCRTKSSPTREMTVAERITMACLRVWDDKCYFALSNLLLIAIIDVPKTGALTILSIMSTQ
jgi:hypothetical protein